MFAQLLHALITFCLATEKKKETRALLKHFSWGRWGERKAKETKQNRSKQTLPHILHDFWSLTWKKHWKQNHKLQIFPISVKNLVNHTSALLAVPPYHRHHLVFSQQTWTGFHLLWKILQIYLDRKIPSSGVPQAISSRKASAEGGYSELLAPSAAATLPELQDRAVGWGTEMPWSPDSNLFP